MNLDGITRPDPRDVLRIRQLVSDEIAAFERAPRKSFLNNWHRATLEEFRAALIKPALIEVHFAGGITDHCYAVTRTNGCYRVIYLPWADIFSLAVESRFGPVDISVHGPALDCFSSV